MTDDAPVLTDEEYEATLQSLAAYEKHLIRSGNLEQMGSLEAAAALAELFEDPKGRWLAERNAERAATAKTERGGRPVDPKSRSQFSTWVKGRYRGIIPRRTYQLLDAHRVTTSYLNNVQISPETEGSVRPLKVLMDVAHGSGERIPEVWDIACELAGHSAPNAEQSRRAINIWNERNLPKGAVRRENIEDRLRRKRYHADWAIDDLFIAAKRDPDLAGIVEEQLEEILKRTQEDLDEIRAMRKGH